MNAVTTYSHYLIQLSQKFKADPAFRSNILFHNNIVSFHMYYPEMKFITKITYLYT